MQVIPAIPAAAGETGSRGVLGPHAEPGLPTFSFRALLLTGLGAAPDQRLAASPPKGSTLHPGQAVKTAQGDLGSRGRQTPPAVFEPSSTATPVPWSFLKPAPTVEGKTPPVFTAKEQKAIPDGSVESVSPISDLTGASVAPAPAAPSSPPAKATVAASSPWASADEAKRSPAAPVPVPDSPHGLPQAAPSARFDNGQMLMADEKLAAEIQAENKEIMPDQAAGVSEPAMSHSLLSAPAKEPAPVTTPAITGWPAEAPQPSLTKTAAGTADGEGLDNAVQPESPSSDARMAAPAERKPHSEPPLPLSHASGRADHSHGDPSLSLAGTAPAAAEHREFSTAVPSPAVAPAHPAIGRGLPEAQHNVQAANANAFQRLDQAPPVTTLHAGPQRLSVGVEDPVRGWIEVRSESHCGDLSTTLSVASEAVHGALRAELPAMHGYLADHQIDVSQLNIEQRSGDATGSGAHSGDARATPDAPPPMVAFADPGTPVEYGGYVDATGVDIRA